MDGYNWGYAKALLDTKEVISKLIEYRGHKFTNKNIVSFMDALIADRSVMRDTGWPDGLKYNPDKKEFFIKCENVSKDEVKK